MNEIEIIQRLEQLEILERILYITTVFALVSDNHQLTILTVICYFYFWIFSVTVSQPTKSDQLGKLTTGGRISTPNLHLECHYLERLIAPVLHKQ